ncbi:MAG: hypothetical protein ACRDPB_00625, partial [Nocardioidaceae bacterium]
MSVMERRLQLLLDADRYRKVADEARRSGRSVAAVIREAIDRRFADEEREAERAAAARRLLASMKASDNEPPYESPAELKAIL